jgi:hypothetical protein
MLDSPLRALTLGLKFRVSSSDRKRGFRIAARVQIEASEPAAARMMFNALDSEQLFAAEVGDPPDDFGRILLARRRVSVHLNLVVGSSRGVQ